MSGIGSGWIGVPAKPRGRHHMSYESSKRDNGLSLASGSGKRTRALLLCSVPALVLALASGVASAQDAPIETIVVTGARAAVAGALDVKRDADKIQDSIVAEDIGKLPDTTVVESLQHVTGISILRTSYEPST